MDTSIRWTLGVGPISAFFQSFTVTKTPCKTDTSLKWTVGAGPDGVCFGESWLDSPQVAMSFVSKGFIIWLYKWSRINFRNWDSFHLEHLLSNKMLNDLELCVIDLMNLWDWLASQTLNKKTILESIYSILLYAITLLKWSLSLLTPIHFHLFYIIKPLFKTADCKIITEVLSTVMFLS